MGPHACAAVALTHCRAEAQDRHRLAIPQDSVLQEQWQIIKGVLSCKVI